MVLVSVKNGGFLRRNSMKNQDLFSDCTPTGQDGGLLSENGFSEMMSGLGLSSVPSEPHVYTVGEISSEIAGLFGSRYFVSVRGELSNCGGNRRGGSYFYCTIKDEEHELSVAFPQRVIQHVYDSIRDGMSVIISGRLSFYKPKGKVTLWGSSVKVLDRQGELYQRFLKTLEVLRSEGLFDMETKKPIPADIRTVGIITSPDGMAVKDVIRTIRRRNRFINIVVYPALVQGNSAVESLKYALWYANRHNVCQVLLMVRGGGSAEDLSCFNDESLARYTKMSVIPVISGVGHEGDVTIMDYVADLRASTPTAAAEMVSVSLEHVIKNFGILRQRLLMAGTGRLNYEIQRFNAIRAGFYNYAPEKRIASAGLRLQSLRERMRLSLIRAYQHQRDYFASISDRFSRQNPQRIILERRAECILARQKMIQLMELHLNEMRHRIAAGASLLNANNPLKILTQGYSVTLTADGRDVSLSGISPGDHIRTVLADGEIESCVTSVRPGNHLFLSSVSEDAGDERTD